MLFSVHDSCYNKPESVCEEAQGENTALYKMPFVKDCLEVLQTLENQSLYIECLREVSKFVVYVTSSQCSVLSIILAP